MLEKYLCRIYEKDTITLKDLVSSLMIIILSSVFFYLVGFGSAVAYYNTPVIPQFYHTIIGSCALIVLGALAIVGMFLGGTLVGALLFSLVEGISYISSKILNVLNTVVIARCPLNKNKKL
jgi:hypothetical protein